MASPDASKPLRDVSRTFLGSSHRGRSKYRPRHGYMMRRSISRALSAAYGCVDNLAWIWVHERGIAVNRRHVGLRRHNKEVRNTFSPEFHSYLESLDSWFEYLVDYRDALAHRIPLYIPPGGARPKEMG
jgi:hypothetical protein